MDLQGDDVFFSPVVNGFEQKENVKFDGQPNTFIDAHVLDQDQTTLRENTSNAQAAKIADANKSNLTEINETTDLTDIENFYDATDTFNVTKSLNQTSEKKESNKNTTVGVFDMSITGALSAVLAKLNINSSVAGSQDTSLSNNPSTTQNANDSLDDSVEFKARDNQGITNNIELDIKRQGDNLTVETVNPCNLLNESSNDLNNKTVELVDTVLTNKQIIEIKETVKNSLSPSISSHLQISSTPKKLGDNLFNSNNQEEISPVKQSFIEPQIVDNRESKISTSLGDVVVETNEIVLDFPIVENEAKNNSLANKVIETNEITAEKNDVQLLSFPVTDREEKKDLLNSEIPIGCNYKKRSSVDLPIIVNQVNLGFSIETTEKSIGNSIAIGKGSDNPQEQEENKNNLCHNLLNKTDEFLGQTKTSINSDDLDGKVSNVCEVVENNEKSDTVQEQGGNTNNLLNNRTVELMEQNADVANTVETTLDVPTVRQEELKDLKDDFEIAESVIEKLIDISIPNNEPQQEENILINKTVEKIDEKTYVIPDQQLNKTIDQLVGMNVSSVDNIHKVEENINKTIEVAAEKIDTVSNMVHISSECTTKVQEENKNNLPSKTPEIAEISTEKTASIDISSVDILHEQEQNNLMNKTTGTTEKILDVSGTDQYGLKENKDNNTIKITENSDKLPIDCNSLVQEELTNVSDNLKLNAEKIINIDYAALDNLNLNEKNTNIVIEKEIDSLKVDYEILTANIPVIIDQHVDETKINSPNKSAESGEIFTEKLIEIDLPSDDICSAVNKSNKLKSSSFLEVESEFDEIADESFKIVTALSNSQNVSGEDSGSSQSINEGKFKDEEIPVNDNTDNTDKVKCTDSLNNEVNICTNLPLKERNLENKRRTISNDRDIEKFKLRKQDKEQINTEKIINPALNIENTKTQRCLERKSSPKKLVSRRTMADISDKVSLMQQEISDLKLQLNATQQKNANLELQIRQKEEVEIKTQAEFMKKEQAYLQENKALKEALSDKTKQGSSDSVECEIKSLKSKNAELVQELNVRNNERINYQNIMQEYEKELGKRLADFEKLKEEYEKLKVEHETATKHLANLEFSFSDVHQKYERSKSVIQGFRANEEVLTKNLMVAQRELKQQEEKYDSLKAHATAQIEKSNKELVQLHKTFEQNMLKQSAVVKRLEIKVGSLEVSLDHKTKENAALAALCDEVTGKRV